jgi:hypothetical protein
MKPSSIKAQFDTGDFQVIREAAARAGLPIRHWAQRVLVAAARRAGSTHVTPEDDLGRRTTRTSNSPEAQRNEME